MQTWQKLVFSVPITEKVIQQDGEYKIKGIAINATTTRNGTRFLAEELEPSAPSLQGRPILKDHNNSVDSIVGKTTAASYDKTQNAVVFEGVIKNPAMQSMINEGLISAVSIGATLKDLETLRDEEGKVEAFVARGIDFVELSLVAVPADPNAGFAKACMESFTLRQSENALYQSQSPSIKQREEASMAEEITAKEKLLAEKAKLEEENASLQLELAKQENMRLKAAKEIADKKAAEAMTSTELKGDTQTEAPAKIESKKDNFLVEGMSKGRTAISISSYDGVEGLNRLKRVM